MKKIIIGSLLGLWAISVPLAATQLELSPGTMLLQGNGGFNWTAPNLSQLKGSAEVGGSGTFGMLWSVVPSFFLGFNIGGGGGKNLDALGDLKSIITVADGFLYAGLSMDYYFSTASIVYPYLGADVNAKWYSTNSISALLRPNVGVAIAVVDNVAIDFGLRGDLEFPVYPALDTYVIKINAGALFAGIKAFF